MYTAVVFVCDDHMISGKYCDISMFCISYCVSVHIPINTFTVFYSIYYVMCYEFISKICFWQMCHPPKFMVEGLDGGSDIHYSLKI